MSEIILSVILSLIIQLANNILPSKPLSLAKDGQTLVISVKHDLPTTLLQNPSETISLQEKIPSQPQIITTTKPIPWGTTEKIGDHLYRTYVENDAQMGTPDEIIAALNKYRRDNNRGTLQKYEPLCPFAQKRANDQENAGTLDSHKGFEEYMKDENHWKELDVVGIGENASYGYILSGTHLIEWVFDSDEEHRSNQLNPEWSLVCPAVSGKTVNILFGKK